MYYTKKWKGTRIALLIKRMKSRELQLAVPTQHHPLDKKSPLFTSYKSINNSTITSRNYQQFLAICPIPTSGSLGKGSIYSPLTRV